MKKLKQKSSNHINVQYAFRYGMIILVTALLVLLLVNWILGEYKEILVTNTREELHESVQELDAAFSKQREIANEIFWNKLTSPYYISQSQMHMQEGILQLNTFRNSLLVNDHLFLKYTEDMLFEEGEVSVEIFSKMTLELNEESTEKLKETVNDADQSNTLVLTDLRNKSMLIFIYPNRNMITNSRGIVGFVVKSSTLQEYFKDHLSNMPIYAIMTGTGGEVFFELNQLEHATQKEIEDLRVQLLQRNTELEDYTADIYESLNGFHLYVAVENDYIFVDFSRMLQGILLWGVIIFIVAMLLISFINTVHVKQIQSIRDNLLRYSGGSEKIGKNELQQIQYLVDRMYQDQKHRNEQRFRLYKNMSAELSKILFGGLIEQEEVLNGILLHFCPELKNSHYAVLGLITDGQGESLERRLSEEPIYSVYSVNEYENKILFSFVAGLSNEDSDGLQRMAFAQRLLEKALDAGMHHAFVVTGRSYKNLCELHKSYREMLFLTSELSMSSKDFKKITIFEDMLRHRKKYHIREE